MADKTEHEAKRETDLAAMVRFAEGATGQFAMVPGGFGIQSLEEFQQRPNRHSANHRFVAVDSLTAYLNRFGTPDTMICADYAAAQIGAVIDGDSVDTPSHQSHRARFEAQTDDRLRAWLAVCGKDMSQVSFGLFLEERAVDVVSPDAADVMDMVMKFDATKKVSFKSSTRLHDGSRQFQYVEENDQRGGVTLPDNFVVLAPVYRGMEPQRIKFMVRYRIEDGALKFQIEMHDKNEVMRAAFERCVDAVKSDLTVNLPIYTVG